MDLWGGSVTLAAVSRSNSQFVLKGQLQQGNSQRAPRTSSNIGEKLVILKSFFSMRHLYSC